MSLKKYGNEISYIAPAEYSRINSIEYRSKMKLLLTSDIFDINS